MQPVTHLLQTCGPRCIERQAISTFRTRTPFLDAPVSVRCQRRQNFNFSHRQAFSSRGTWASKLSEEDGTEVKKQSDDDQLDSAIGNAKELQSRTPWHRQGADDPPVRRLRSAGAMTKGM